MLYLCLSLPQLPLESREPVSDAPVAVTDRKAARRWLIACNAACHDAGIHPGLAATTAQTLRPDLRLIERSPSEEQASLKYLAAWAEQFSSWVCFDPERLQLWLEIGSALRYFGGLDTLRSRLEGGLAQLGYTARLGIAPTLEAAAALCNADDAQVIRHASQLLAETASLPLAVLYLDDEVADALGSMGLRTVGEVLALPRDSLARRFGPELIDYLDRLTGAAADPRKPFRAPRKYRRRFEFLGSVESCEGLLFPIRRMLHELQGFLLARDAAVQSVALDLCHDGIPPTNLEIRTTRPLRDAVRLFALVRERLERTELPAPVEELVIHIERLVPLGNTQMELLDTGRRRDEGWEGLLDKLRARLGDAAIKQLGLRDDHRPEHAWCVVNGNPGVAEAPILDRPLWLLEPRLLSSLPRRLGQPERIEAGWPCGKDESRDYYIAEAVDGARLWVYRDAEKGQWFVHGLWA